jgi:hypothetical protein
VDQTRERCGGDANGETLVIVYTNAQSVVGKVNKLAWTMSDLKPDLILLTGTWCNSAILDAYLTIPGN